MRESKNSPHPRGKTRREFTPSREWMIEHYVNGDMTGTQVRELTGYSKSGFQHLLKVYGLEGKGTSLPKLQITREELYQMHVIEGLTAVKIAAKLGCHNSAISRLIKQYKLDPERQLVNIPMTPPLSHDELWKLYWVDNKSAGEIATRYGVARATALRWFRYYDIPRRKWNGGEVKRTYVRNPNANNRDGKEFNAQERERIFQRDKYRCQMPGCDCAERLEVHHIIPIKYGGDNALNNGITLCYWCHEKIKYHELEFASLFKSIVTLVQEQICCIGETPEEGNTEPTPESQGSA